MVCLSMDILVSMFDLVHLTEKHFLEVKCRLSRLSSLTVACPYCCRVFALESGGLGTLRAQTRDCPHTYPFRPDILVVIPRARCVVYAITFIS